MCHRQAFIAHVSEITSAPASGRNGHERRSETPWKWTPFQGITYAQKTKVVVYLFDANKLEKVYYGTNFTRLS